MTRKEERAQAAHKYINSDVVSPGNEYLAFGDFINGAEWADSTTIKKACEAFCKVRCNGKPPRSTCTSLGTCLEHDEFRKALEQRL